MPLYLKSSTRSYSAAQLPDGTTISGLSKDHLRKVLFNYLVEQNAVPENFEAFFQDAVCRALSPERRERECASENPPAELQGRRITLWDAISFVKTAASWVKSGRVVSQEEADRRSGICAGCPYNQTVVCGPCTGAASLAAEALGGLTTKRDGELKGCAVCGCVLRLKVWCPTEAIPTSGYEYPEWCWQRVTDQ